MKRIALVFIIAVFAASSLSFVSDTLEMLIPGVGIENYVTVNATTKTAIRTKYGSDGKEEKHYSTTIGTGTKSLYSTELIYKKQGVSFYFRPESDTVFCIKTFAPFKGKTDKGIVLGTSTMQDVANAYGHAEWIFSGKYMFLEYSGIDFRVSFDGKFPVLQKTQDEAMNKKVEVIAITGFEE